MNKEQLRKFFDMEMEAFQIFHMLSLLTDQVTNTKITKGIFGTCHCPQDINDRENNLIENLQGILAHSEYLKERFSEFAIDLSKGD